MAGKSHAKILKFSRLAENQRQAGFNHSLQAIISALLLREHNGMCLGGSPENVSLTSTTVFALKLH
jgi:hypothetical protein